MPIITGQNGVASDFINESQKNATPSNDEGRVPKLEANAKLNNAFIEDNASDIVVGEDIDGSTTPKACFVGNGSESLDDIVNVGAIGSSRTIITPNQILGAVINTVNYDKITSIKWNQFYNNNMDSTDQVIAEIYAVDGSNLPTGSAMVSKSVDWSDWNGGFNEKITFDTPVTVSKNTNYAFCFKNGANSVGEEFGLGKSSTQGPFEDELLKFTGSWTKEAGQYPMDFTLEGFELLTVGKIYLSNKNIGTRNFFDGFIKEDLSADDNGYLYINAVNNLTGLTGGSTYYIDEDGDIASSGSVVVGKAMSATSIKIER